MALITDYASLKDNIADWIVKSNLTNQIEVFIQLAEAELKRDKRARKLQTRTFQISADGMAMPTDFHSLEEWYHDGPTHHGDIQIVPAGHLARIKARFGATGVPAYAAIVGGRRFRFGPAPDATYSTKMEYWRRIPSLSSSVTTNWLLTDHPDIYLYGSLMQAAPYLKDDERIPVWQSRYDRAIESLHQATQDEQWGGGSVRRHFDAIG